MRWKGYNHLSTQKPATASVECKADVGKPEKPWNCVVSNQTPAASFDCCMTNDTGNLPDREDQRRYKWPWFVLAAVLLAIVLAVLWMSKEIARTRRIRDLNAPPPATNRGATLLAPAWPAGPEQV